jgi:hypothetical protein
MPEILSYPKHQGLPVGTPLVVVDPGYNLQGCPINGVEMGERVVFLRFINLGGDWFVDVRKANGTEIGFYPRRVALLRNEER